MRNNIRPNQTSQQFLLASSKFKEFITIYFPIFAKSNVLGSNITYKLDPVIKKFNFNFITIKYNLHFNQSFTFNSL